MFEVTYTSYHTGETIRMEYHTRYHAAQAARVLQYQSTGIEGTAKVAQMPRRQNR